MVKKVNQLGIKIKTLYEAGFRPISIARELKIRKQKVNYWLKTEIKRKTKLNEEEIQRVVELAENRKTSEMGSRKIESVINNELKKKGIKLRKMKKVFALNEGQKKDQNIAEKF